MAIVKFNRQYTSAQLKAARNTSSIAGGTNNVVNGTLYIASDGDGIYIGNASNPSVLKLLGQTDTTLTAAQIISLLNDYVDPEDPSTMVPYADVALSANYASEAGKAAKDGDGNTISSTYKKVQTAVEDSAVAGQYVSEVDQNTQGVITVRRASLPTATVDKDASSSASAIATNTDVSSANAALSVATGYTVVQTSGALVPNSSSIDSGRADKFGAANAALVQAKSYADDLITGLGTILTFKGTVATEAALKALTNQKKGWVYIVTADGSEWVCTDDIGSTAVAANWEKFGTTDVNGALYYGDNTLTSGYIFIADGTAGKAKTTDTLGFDLNVGTTSARHSLNVTDDLTVYDDITVTTGDITVTSGGITTGGNATIGGDASVAGDATVTGELNVTGPATFADDISALSVSTSTIKSSSAIVRNDGETDYTILDTSNIGTAATKTVDGVTHASGVINAYGECSVAAGTAAKTVTITSGSIGTIDATHGLGTRVAVKFASANTASTPTLNVNSKGAKSISIQGSIVTTGDEKNLIKGTIIFEWVGNAWEVIGLEKGSGSTGSTSSATDAWKTVVHDVALSADLVLSGNTKSIPAAVSASTLANSSEGYMTAQEAYDLYLAKINAAAAVLALTWEGETA